MIALNLITQLCDIIYGDRRPEYQRSITIYSDGFGRSVTIVEFIYISHREEFVYIEVDICGKSIRTNDWEELDIMLQVNGLLLGNWADDEMVSLTPLGEQEASLLSSVPYLFQENANSGE